MSGAGALHEGSCVDVYVRGGQAFSAGTVSKEAAWSDLSVPPSPFSLPSDGQ